MSASFALLAAIVFLTSGHGCAFPMRWCVLSDKEQAKCMDFQAAIGILANKLKMQVQFSCVIGPTPKDCMMKIKSGSADLITLDGGHIQTAGKDHDLVPVVGEDYYNLPGLDGVSYKAVAVAKKSNRYITFQKLKGKKSCHTGADKTAGWNVPVGTLLRMGIMQQDKSCNAYVSAGKFFDKSCVPNVRDKDPNAANLCALCPTECDNTQGIYYGYSGAFKCMNAGLGDVAFIKHTTLKENNANPDEYVYLCKDGRREASWENCYLANVPAHAVMTKSSHDHNSNFRHLLVKASEDYGVNQTNSSMFQLFNSSKYDGSDLLFKDSTKRLVAVGERNSYQRWLGEDYLKDFEVLNSCPGAKKATFTPTASKKGKRNKPHLFIALVSFVAMVIAVFF